MASATDQDRKMADDDKDERDEQDKLPYRSPAGGEVAREKSGFFRIYKTGQGYWTRILTASGAGIIIIFVAEFCYSQLPILIPALRENRPVHMGVVIGIAAALSLLAFMIINKPRNADFLIATDSEMKKVNWTSRKELFGSTKVVIIFMFAITLFLFLFDIVFGYLFHVAGVLELNPLDMFSKK